MADKANDNGRAAAGKPTTKMEAVRRCLADLGTETKPLRVREYLMEKFRIDISPLVANDYKKRIVKEMRGRVGPESTKPAANSARATPVPASAPPAAATSAVNLAAPKLPTPRSAAKHPSSKNPSIPKARAGTAPSVASNGTASGTVVLADIQIVKTLVSRVGANDLKALIDLLAQ